MTEVYVVHCDHCKCDITETTEEKSYRIRLMEEGRVPIANQLSQVKELERFMNFCHLDHLKEWLAQR